MPAINHRRPNTQRTCLGGRCCPQCGFVCHRHWIARQFPTGIRAGETAEQAWFRQPAGAGGMFEPPQSVRDAGAAQVVQQWAATTTRRTNDGVVAPPRANITVRRNNSYDVVRRG